MIKKNYKLLLYILAISIVSLLGLSCAYWIINLKQTNSNIASLGCFKTEFSDSNPITLTNIFPLTLEQGQELVPYTFTITNTCTIDALYQVNLETLNTSTLEDYYMDVSISPDSASGIGGLTPTTPILTDAKSAHILKKGGLKAGESVSYNLRLWMDYKTPQSEGENKTYQSKVTITTTANSFNTLATALISSYGGITAIESKPQPDFSKTPQFYLNYKEVQKGPYTEKLPEAIIYEKNTIKDIKLQDLIIKESNFKLNIEKTSSSLSNLNFYVVYTDTYSFDTATGIYTLSNLHTCQFSSCYASLANKYIDSDNYYLDEASATAAITQDLKIQNFRKIVNATYNVATSSGTLTYYDISYEPDEFDTGSNGMFAMADDYGTSYYLRGYITDNNVLFAGFCWQVIRINGNGTIKLIYNGSPQNGTCPEKNSNSFIAKSNYSDDLHDNAYIGYMYGKTNSFNYDATHANTNSSVIKTVIDNWYDTNLKNYRDEISDTLFCNDRTIAQNSSSFSGYTSLGYSTYQTIYSTYSRLFDTSDKPLSTPQISLKCPNQHDRFTVRNTTIGNGNLSYPIALLTADEAILTGILGSYSISTSNSFLNCEDDFWTMSPSYYKTTNSSNIFLVGNNYLFPMRSSADLYYKVKPVINLNADVITFEGNGTFNSPYSVY